MLREDQKKIDLFLQDLMLNNGLYFYLCTVPNRRNVARTIVVPIFDRLLEASYEFTNPSLLRRHVLKGFVPDSLVAAGEFAYDKGAQFYEALYQSLNLKMISPYEFIRDLDDQLTQFMLLQLNHRTGDKSPRFDLLVDECEKRDILWDEDIPKLFKRVHLLRSRGLHRLEREIPETEVSQIALRMYFFFDYIDDYWEAQSRKTVRLTGKRYRRIRYGSEIRHLQWQITPKMRAEWKESIKNRCHDCGVKSGELHLEGCDFELCPRCGGQFLGCACLTDKDLE